MTGPEIVSLDFDPPIVIPATGFVGLSVAGNFSPAGAFSWLSVSDAVDIGMGDPTRMLVNGVPTDGSSFNLGKCTGGVRDGLWCNGATGNIDCGAGTCDDINDNLAFEIVAIGNANDPTRACCISETGACATKLPWECTAGGDTAQPEGTSCAACTNNILQACTTDADCPACVGGLTPGATCTVDGDCPQGTCSGTSTCFLTPPACTVTACCNGDGTCTATVGGLCSNDESACANDLDCAAGETCDAQCADGPGSGFGTKCDPNACEQPIMTGGDNCFDTTVNQITVPLVGSAPVTVTVTGNNSAATFDDFNEGVCVGGTAAATDAGTCKNGTACSIAAEDCADGTACLSNRCDPNIGSCADLSACTVSAQDCADASACQTDDTQCAAAGGECTRICGNGRNNPAGGNPDPAWWESFHINDCADIRIDFCTTSPVLQPAWAFLQAGCPCGATVANSGTLQPIGPDGADETSDGSERGMPFCDEDNLWQTFRALPPGTYYYPVNSTPNGTFAVPPGGDYQFHVTAGACRKAACCSNLCEGGSRDGQPCAPKVCQAGATPGAECIADGDCGVDGTCTNGGVDACPGIAANCVNGTCSGGALDGLPCNDLTGEVDQCPDNGVCGATGCAEVNEMVCSAANGFWLAGADFPDNVCDGGTAAGQECDTNADCPGATCIANNDNVSCGLPGAPSPCDIGSCCAGPGSCEDRTPDSGAPIRRIDCQSPRVFRGGARCLFEPSPCPICTVPKEGNCLIDDSGFGTFMDRANPTQGGVKVADDFIALSPAIEQFCFTPAFFILTPGAAFFDCADPNGQFGPPADDFEIRFFTDDNGVPGQLVSPAHELAPAIITAKAWTGEQRAPQRITWDYSIVFDPPLGGFVVGERYWIEFSGAGNENCLVGLVRTTQGNNYSLNEQDHFDPDNQTWTLEDRLDARNDASYCIGGTSSPSIEIAAPLTGACCQCSGVCTDGVPWEDCLGYTCFDDCPDGVGAGTAIAPLFENGTFFPNQLCQDLLCEDVGAGGGCAGGNIAELEDCELPMLVTDGSFTLNTTCSTTDGRATFPPGNGCGGGTFVNDVWLEYTATCSGNVQFDLCGDSDYDVMFAVYSNGTSECPTECPPPLDTLLGGQCTDIECPAEAGAPSFEFFGSPGVCYKIRVGGDGAGSFGTVELAVQCEFTVCDLAEPLVLDQISTPSGAKVTSNKNRFLSFSGGTPGRNQAVRIRLVDMPAPYNGWTVDDQPTGGDGLGDTVLWVGEPFALSELSGKDDDTSPTFMAAPLECELTSALFRDWSEMGVIHVFGEAIIPGATYDIQMLDTTCSELIPEHFSEKVTVVNPRWADAVGPFNAGEWTAPNNSVDVGGDVVAILDKFKNVPTAPTKARADIQPRILDFKINIVDVTRALDGFSGAQYPFTPSKATACP